MTNVTDERFVVQIVEDETGKIEYQSKPTHRRRAEKIEDGMGINLDWAHFSTRIIDLNAQEGE